MARFVKPFPVLFASLHDEMGRGLSLLPDGIERLRKEPQARRNRHDRDGTRRFVMERGGVFDHAAAMLACEAGDLHGKVSGLSQS